MQDDRDALYLALIGEAISDIRRRFSDMAFDRFLSDRDEQALAAFRLSIIGENAKPDDLEVNPMKSKQLTNFRSTGKDDAIRLTPPKVMTLEQAIAYIDDDEMVEVTPKNIRIRKALLDPHERKKASRKKEEA